MEYVDRNICSESTGDLFSDFAGRFHAFDLLKTVIPEDKFIQCKSCANPPENHVIPEMRIVFTYNVIPQLDFM